MSQYLLNRKWFHRMIDRLMPENCRQSLETALIENKSASSDFVKYINKNEHHVIAAMKNDRRHKERVV